MKYPEINAIYDHYKGGRYKVITLAKHTETDEILVIYKSIHFGTIYDRPLEQWFNTIEQTNQQRFTKVNKKDQ